MPKLVAVVQARMDSKRLPEKVMLPLAGYPVIWHIFSRLKKLSVFSDFVLATSEDKTNNNLVSYSKDVLKVKVFRALSENDICSRLYGAAKLANADSILKINADCPIVDLNVLSLLIDAYKNDSQLDYISNKFKWTFPKGMSVEIISMSALTYCHKHVSNKRDRELIADWIKNDKYSIFKKTSIVSSQDYGKYNWMLDTPEDYTYLKHVFDKLYGIGNDCFGIKEVLNLESNPILKTIDI
jgi:spore coat polysaccharide biosynthesis protein SpsF (cytidylyltransferase family)